MVRGLWRGKKRFDVLQSSFKRLSGFSKEVSLAELLVQHGGLDEPGLLPGGVCDSRFLKSVNFCI